MTSPLVTASTGTAAVSTVERHSVDTTHAISGAMAHSVYGSLNTLAIVLALAGVPTPLRTYSRTSGANMSVAVQEWDLGGAVLSAISDLHDQLLARARALPMEAAQVLYSNLWDLYVD